jgi:thiamine kinase-like enzyme
MWPPRIGGVKREYLALKFLTNLKLNKCFPKLLDFFPKIPAYIYEESPGSVLKKLLPKHGQLKIKKFLNFIPAVALTIKKIHSIKKKPPYATPFSETRQKMTRQLKNSLDLIKKFYPHGYLRFKKMADELENFKRKNQDHLFNKLNFSLIHGDFQIDNILMSKNKNIIFLDWADSDFFNPLDDIGSFFMQTELHLKYVLPKSYRTFLKKIKKIFIENYFPSGINPVQQMQIDYFETKDILRIITFIAFTEKHLQPMNYSRMMESLLDYAGKKIENFKKNYL